MVRPAILLAMVRKDLLRQSRQPLGMLLVLAFPVIFSALLAVTFGRSGQSMPKIDLLVENRDEGFVSGLLVGALQREQFTQYADITVVDGDGDQRMERGEASALLRIPAGFSGALLAGETARLELVRNPAQGIFPEIAEQMFTVAVDVLDSGSRILREPLDQFAPFMESESGPSEADVLRMSATLFRVVQQAESRLFPPVVTLESVQLEDPEANSAPAGSATIFLLILPGVSVWALFTLGDVAMRDMLRESMAGTLRRQLSAPLRVGDIVVAKAFYTATVALFSLAILTALGVTMLDRPVSLPAFATLSLALIVAVTGFAALIYGIARNERQGATIASVLVLLFAFVGGSFVPLESMPAGVQRIAPFSLFYWGVSGFKTLIADGGGLGDIALNVGVLAALGVGMLLLGSRFLAARVRSGVAA